MPGEKNRSYIQSAYPVSGPVGFGQVPSMNSNFQWHYYRGKPDGSYHPGSEFIYIMWIAYY